MLIKEGLIASEDDTAQGKTSGCLQHWLPSPSYHSCPACGALCSLGNMSGLAAQAL